MAANPMQFLSAAQKNNAELLTKLIESGVAPGTANGAGQSAVHIAALWGNHAALMVLIDAGAPLSTMNNVSGATPLHCAAASNKNFDGRMLCAKSLIEAGADTQVKDNRQLPAWKYSDNDEMRMLLGGVPMAEDYELDDDDDDEIPEKEKTPVTIVTGFLGSGKTTLVNYVLKEQHGKRIAVIENEFGEVNIDKELLQSGIGLQEKEDVITMDNGCVCCTVRGDLVKAFQQIAARPEKFDAVILETTGLADPAPVAFTFNTKPEVGKHFRIDCIVTLVDSKHAQQHIDEVKPDGVVNEAVQQIAFADRILLNKTDLVSSQEKRDIKELIRSINEYADIMECQRSRAPLDKLFGIGSFSLESVTSLVDPAYYDDDSEEEECTDEHCTQDHSHSHSHSHGHGHDHDHKCAEESCSHPEHGHAHGHDSNHTPAEEPSGHSHGHSHGEKPAKKKRPARSEHLSGVSSVGLTVEGELDMVKFQTFMRNLLREKANDIYRSKGVLKVANRPEKFLFHGVHENIEFEPAEKPWEPNEKAVNKVVFIGKKLNRQELQDSFTACVSQPEA